MPSLIEKAFDQLVETVEENVAWARGVGSEWACAGLIDAQFLEDLVRLAFEAPKEDRDAFIAKWDRTDA